MSLTKKLLYCGEESSSEESSFEREIMCDICGEEIQGSAQELAGIGPKSRFQVEYVDKHFDCGPEVRCYECMERIDVVRVVPIDIWGGYSEIRGKDVFLNYCSNRCADKDEQYLLSMWDDLMNHTTKRYEYFEMKLHGDRIFKVRKRLIREKKKRKTKIE